MITAETAGTITAETAGTITAVHSAAVHMRNYTDDEIAAYIASGDPMDKAGAYAIQNDAFRPVARLDGCYLSVMGLSICQLLQEMQALGIEIKADLTAVAEVHRGYPCPILSRLS